MKRACLFLVLAALLFCTPACADVAGALTETELNAWLDKLILSTADATPLNAPIGEDAYTQDGYAFLYDSATLYYDRPALDEQSVLSAVTITNSSLDTPRNVRLGAPVDMLMSAYGWQNPTLVGDEAFAPLYVLNALPEGAYWALAQRSDNKLQSVQCAVHARAGEDRYTDAGILYTVQNGEVAAIRIYGLNTFITRAEVESNLTAVGGPAALKTTVATFISDAEAFGPEDLQFGRMDFMTLTEKGAALIFGAPSGENWAQDDGGGWLHTLTCSGATLMFGMDADQQNPRLESMTITSDAVIGPRGMTVGMQLDNALALFRCDTALEADGAVPLYGDGQTPPYATLQAEDGGATLLYVTAAADPEGKALEAALYLVFTDNQLTEMTIYTF